MYAGALLIVTFDALYTITRNIRLEWSGFTLQSNYAVSERENCSFSYT